MMLANTKTILEKARKGNYAVGHFNINNMEILQGVVQAANNLKAPVIVATSEGAIEYAGINFLHDLVKTASELSKVPVALHLDHGKNFKIIKQCIDLGYSSVMIDAS
ncbi:MAG: fructose-bisphosphate aldolase, partial [Bdellovibrio sp. CG10_big_fil_rev_8_21_14_0_10_47_8]